MSTDRPVWHGGEKAAFANWRGMTLTATADAWQVHRNGERLTGGYWRQQPGQRAASAATRLEQHKQAAYAAAFRRAANANQQHDPNPLAD